MIGFLFPLMLSINWSIIQQAGDHVRVMGDLTGGEGTRAKEEKEERRG